MEVDDLVISPVFSVELRQPSRLDKMPRQVRDTTTIELPTVQGGTCHKCARSLKNTPVNESAKCANCGIRYHTSDCGQRFSQQALEGPLDVCPKCEKLCECAGGVVTCHAFSMRSKRQRPNGDSQEEKRTKSQTKRYEIVIENLQNTISALRSEVQRLTAIIAQLTGGPATSQTAYEQQKYRDTEAPWASQTARCLENSSVQTFSNSIPHSTNNRSSPPQQSALRSSPEHQSQIESIAHVTTSLPSAQQGSAQGLLPLHNRSLACGDMASPPHVVFLPPPAQQDTQGEDVLDSLILSFDDGLLDSLDWEAEEAPLAREPSDCSGNPPQGLAVDESSFVLGPQATVESLADGTSLVCTIKQDMNKRSNQIIKLAIFLFFAKLLVWDTLDVIGFDHVMLFYRLILERLYLVSGESPSKIALVVLTFLLRTFSFLMDATSLSTVLVGVKLKNPEVFGGHRPLLISVAFYMWTILLFVAALAYGASRCWQLVHLSWQGDVPQLSSCNKLELEEGFTEKFDDFDQALKDEDRRYWSEEFDQWTLPEKKKKGKKKHKKGNLSENDSQIAELQDFYEMNGTRTGGPNGADHDGIHGITSDKAHRPNHGGKPKGRHHDGKPRGPKPGGKPEGRHRIGKPNESEHDQLLGMSPDLSLQHSKNSPKGLFEVDCEVWSESIPLNADTQLAFEFLSLALSLAFSFGYVHLVQCIRRFVRRLNVVHPLHAEEKTQQRLLHVEPASALQLLPKEAPSES